ncbi:MAG: PIG-L family deacetylase [Actinomycetales bacterium]|nr:PIG-L family deacetylase [Actinomycetales bacterium]
MSHPSSLIVLHAHPDDESIFTGATIRRAADAGVRVVVISATSGEAGEPQVSLAAGETLRQRRVTELERACEVLGAARLVLLGYLDSGAHLGPYPAGSLGAARVSEVAGRVERVVREENASALVYYDRRGIYGHVDHVQVHRVGQLVARWTGITGYQATVDRQQLRRGPYHVVQHAAGDDRRIGVSSHRVSCTVEASTTELLAKMAAMSAHASQIGPRWLDPSRFATGYGREWFVRQGGPGLVDALSTARPVPAGRPG